MMLVNKHDLTYKLSWTPYSIAGEIGRACGFDTEDEAYEFKTFLAGWHEYTKAKVKFNELDNSYFIENIHIDAFREITGCLSTKETFNLFIEKAANLSDKDAFIFVAKLFMLQCLFIVFIAIVYVLCNK